MQSTISAARPASIPSDSDIDYRYWLNRFKQNARGWQTFSANLDFSALSLSATQLKSIQTFQLGEQGEGSTLKALAERFATQSNNPYYLQAIQQFVKEEQRHASHLAQVLEACGHTTADKEWSDGLFRAVRKLCGLELMISVLLTAEIIAISYYSALSKTTAHPDAKRLFLRIHKDELAHLAFHAQHLRATRRRFSALRWGLHRLFVGCVSALVWHEHREILKCQFAGFWAFAKCCDRLLKHGAATARKRW